MTCPTLCAAMKVARARGDMVGISTPGLAPFVQKVLADGRSNRYLRNITAFEEQDLQSTTLQQNSVYAQGDHCDVGIDLWIER